MPPVTALQVVTPTLSDQGTVPQDLSRARLVTVPDPIDNQRQGEVARLVQSPVLGAQTGAKGDRAGDGTGVKAVHNTSLRYIQETRPERILEISLETRLAPVWTWGPSREASQDMRMAGTALTGPQQRSVQG